MARAGDDTVVVKWSGTSALRTRPFHVDGSWELQWDTAKGMFSATLHRLSGHGAKDDLLAIGMEGGSSSSYQPNGGDFYIEFEAMQPWSARAVLVPAGHATAPEEEGPLLAVEGDQSGLPRCDSPDSEAQLTHVIENSPLAQTMHLSVLHVSSIKARPIKDGMSICKAIVVTNGGEAAYDFQYFRKDGAVYIYAQPVEVR